MHSMARWAGTATAAAVLLSGCTSADPGSDDAKTGQSSSTRLTASGPGGSAGPTGTSGPAAIPTSPEEAVHTIALSAADLPADWSVEGSPTDGNLDDDPTFLGLCDFEFLSERRRTAKAPVTGSNPAGDAVLATEAVAYDEYDAAQLALIELRGAYENCPPDQTFTEIPVIDQTGLAEDRVVVEYTLAEGTTQTVIVQRRGALLSVILGEARLIVFDVARKIFQRMAALSPEAVGER
ncbi:MAG: hypothetical protein M3446_07955 [Actinomycetota bacterium]|nr:hypothetical protein [Actinomycetota bacterium]